MPRSPERLTRALILAAVFVCAACGLVYELALVALGSYLLGNTITQASIVLGVMVFAMGVGALASKRLTGAAARNFAIVELLLAVVGGASVMVLYAAFAWFSLYQPTLVLVTFVIGLLIGAEIPLLMTMLQRIRKQEAADAVADLFAADYVGALLGGLAFPFLLLPWLGLLDGTIAVGAVNAAVGVGVCAVVFRADLGRILRWGMATALVLVLAGLGALAAYGTTFELNAQQQIYRDPIALSKRTPYQDVVVTRSFDGQDVRLFLNGDLQFSTLDEYRYHESLVQPAMNGPHARVLILGGGDGLAAYQVLRNRGVASVTLVDLDPEVVHLARTDRDFLRFNHGSMNDARVRYVAADAFTWLRTHHSWYDVIVADFPDADDMSTAKLYSRELYGLVGRSLATGGRLVVQSGSPYYARRYYWTVGATLKAAGFATTAYHVDVPTFGDWGFFLARRGAVAPSVTLAADHPPTRFVTDPVLSAARVFAPDRGPEGERASTLLDPVILQGQGGAYRGY